MNLLSGGFIAGILGALGMVTIAAGHPALGAFFENPTTATVLTAVVTGALTLVAGALKGWSADKPKNINDDDTKAPMLGRAGGAIALAFLLGGLLAFGGGSAHAAVLAKKPDLLTQISTALAQLAAKGTADIQAADALAAAIDPTTGQLADAIAHACYPQAIKFIQSLPKPMTSTAGLGPVQLFEQKRLAVSLVKQGLPSYLVIGCAPLLQDEAVTLTKFLGMLGVAVAIPASGGLALPALPALGGLL